MYNYPSYDLAAFGHACNSDGSTHDDTIARGKSMGHLVDTLDANNIDIGQVIFSGGSSYWATKQNNNFVTEAEALLVNAQTTWRRTPENIVLECESTSIIENFMNTAKLINSSPCHGVLIVTGELYIPRVTRIGKIALEKPFKVVASKEALHVPTVVGEVARWATTLALAKGLKKGSIDMLHEREQQFKSVARRGKAIVSACKNGNTSRATQY